MLNIKKSNSSQVINSQINTNKQNSIQNDYNNEPNLKNNSNEKLSTEQKTEISKLKAREKEVIAHEQAHKSVGGQFSGAMSYTYTTGPDGKRYVSGGEVSIAIPGGEPSEKLIQDLRQVKRAALAPANPSGQDMSVASSADAKIQKMQSELNKAYFQNEEKPESEIDLLI